MEGNSSGSIGGIVGRHHPHHEPREGGVNINVNVEGDLNVNLSRENNFHHLQGRHGLGAQLDSARQDGQEGLRNSLLYEAGVGEGMKDAFKAYQKEKLIERRDGEGEGGGSFVGSVASGIREDGNFTGISKRAADGANFGKHEKDSGYIDCEWDRALGDSFNGKRVVDERKEK